MGRFQQHLLPLHDEIIVDMFAGGGGASSGIEMATGRMVDVAVNHSEDAVEVHRLNHPLTDHRRSDVFEVDPNEVTDGRPVGLLWASPDCTFFSKARNSKPLRSSTKKRRALSWVVRRWAGQVRPRIICLENVEEFSYWCRLVAKRCKKTGRVKKTDGTVAAPGEQVPVQEQMLVPDMNRQGERFQAFVDALEAMGYEVQWRPLSASDYGAPTTRRRLFMVARCDGEPIVWPERTHGAGTPRRRLTAADCILWDTPMLSVLAGPEAARQWARVHDQAGIPRRPLADATNRRVAVGLHRFIIEAENPFHVSASKVPHSTFAPGSGPLPLLAADQAAAALIQTGYGERPGQAPRCLDLEAPLGTVVGGGQKHALVVAFLAKHYGGVVGHALDRRSGIGTITAVDHHSLVAASAVPEDPAGHGTWVHKMGIKVARYLHTHLRDGDGVVDPAAPVTVVIGGIRYVIVDIAMRMLQPPELLRAQGFPEGYRVDRGADGRVITKGGQVRLIGNSVCPPVAEALVRANAQDMVVRDAARRAS